MASRRLPNEASSMRKIPIAETSEKPHSGSGPPGAPHTLRPAPGGTPAGNSTPVQAVLDLRVTEPRSRRARWRGRRCALVVFVGHDVRRPATRTSATLLQLHDAASGVSMGRSRISVKLLRVLGGAPHVDVVGPVADVNVADFLAGHQSGRGAAHVARA